MGVPEESQEQPATSEIPRLPRPRSPLIIGAIAYALLFFMMMTICLIIAWRLSTT